MAGPRSWHHHRQFSRNHSPGFPKEGTSAPQSQATCPDPGCQGPRRVRSPATSPLLCAGPPPSQQQVAGPAFLGTRGCPCGEGLVRKWLFLQEKSLGRNFRSYSLYCEACVVSICINHKGASLWTDSLTHLQSYMFRLGHLVVLPLSLSG